MREVNYNTWTSKFDNFPDFQSVISDSPLSDINDISDRPYTRGSNYGFWLSDEIF